MTGSRLDFIQSSLKPPPTARVTAVAHQNSADSWPRQTQAFVICSMTHTNLIAIEFATRWSFGDTSETASGTGASGSLLCVRLPDSFSSYFLLQLPPPLPVRLPTISTTATATVTALATATTTTTTTTMITTSTTTASAEPAVIAIATGITLAAMQEFSHVSL